MPLISIVIPAKNESKRISRTLSSYGAYLKSHQIESEIIVVLNKTTDNSRAVIEKYQKQYPFIKIIETPYASGKGGAVALGIKNATGKFIAYVDADGSSPVSELNRLLLIMQESSYLDGVIASRYLPGANVSPPPTLPRYVTSRLFNLAVKLFFNLNYQDTQCGLKIFKKEVAQNIASKISIHKWSFDVNLLLLARYMNYRIEEIPTNWSGKNDSRLNLRSALSEIPDELIRLKTYDVSYLFYQFLDRIRWHKKQARQKPTLLIMSWRYVKHPDAGGAEVYLQNIAERLVRKYDVHIFTSASANLSSHDELNGVKIIRRGGKFSVYLWAFIYYLIYFRKDMDLIFDVQNGVPFWTPLYSRKPIVALVHHIQEQQWFQEIGLPFSMIGYLLERFIMPICYRGRPVVTVSDSSRIDLEAIGIQPENIYLASNAVSIPKVKTRKSTEPLLLYLGRLKKYKRIEIAINAVKRLVPSYPNIKLLIVGKGNHRAELENIVQKNRLEDCVQFLGFVSEKEKFELMKKSWLFLMPSSKEGFGVTVLEAAGQQTPTVGFDVPGVNNSVKHNQTGLLANNYSEYVKMIKLLINNSNTRRQMGVNSMQWAATFNWTQSAKLIDKLLQSELNKDLVSEKIFPWSFTAYSEPSKSLRY